ncbi:MAG TPA: globin family protein [Steroidobacteraceae bacterium]|jgi:hemoglobin-like flavoprotein|nr:globin family protein [Steroidobacteraceae bacterium]
MNPMQISLVQNSWRQVLPIRDQAAALFYGRLFELDPALRALFRHDMTEQGRKLTAMINIAVNGLDDLSSLVPAVQDLGRRHVRYGVTEHHYSVVGAALLWTLQQGLGSAFTADVHDAWAATYEVLANTMKHAAAAEPVSA